jgi:3-methyladenine DNA glycosylase Tag
VERHWFVTIDVARLRRALHGARAVASRAALAPAASAAGVRVVDACVVGCGIRALVTAPSKGRLRIFVRRFTAWCGRLDIPWRPRFRVAPVSIGAVPAVRAQLRRMRETASEVVMIESSAKARGAGGVRKLTSLVRHVDRSIDQILGADEVAARVRRYVGEHDAPPDDRSAYSRLCVVIFAQGIGFETVMAKTAELNAAFDGFDPKIVATYDEARTTALLDAPIIRNASKIRACVENGRRWCALAEKNGTYLGRVASVAAADDPAQGWPALATVVRDDFVHVGDSAARQALKRWGFFTAFAHPGARRAMERLGCIQPAADGAAAQRLIGAAAQRLGRDPYAVEAAFALFAGIGPCGKSPKCDRCSLADRCPSAEISA